MSDAPILPGSTIGVLGSGQLGRMSFVQGGSHTTSTAQSVTPSIAFTL